MQKSDRQQIALIGFLNYLQTKYPELSFNTDNEVLPRPPEPIEPFTTENVLGSFDFDEWELEGVDPETLQCIQQNFMSVGMKGHLDDGIITPEELLMCHAAQGEAELRAQPSAFHISQNELDAAKKLLEKYDLSDPDGSIAIGLAVHAEGLANEINTGLGIAHQATILGTQTPVVVQTFTI